MSPVFAQEITPTQRVEQSIIFGDDMDLQDLRSAVSKQLDLYKRLTLTGTITFGDRTYPKSVIVDSLVSLDKIVKNFEDCLSTKSKEECFELFNQDVNREFDFYEPIDLVGNALKTKFTSYYSPDLQGSLKKNKTFKNPIYKKPQDPKLATETRFNIDFKGVLKNKGLELLYVKQSLYDIYLLHVQGSGRVELTGDDGKKEYKYLNFGGKNGLPFKMIYHYMKEKGYLGADTSIPAQREFLDKNPGKQGEIFATSPSYVFYNLSDTPPVGVQNIQLTPHRSLAIDTTLYPTTGLINFIRTKKVVGLQVNHQPIKEDFSRFYLSQDTGASIKGAARCDLYAGFGPQAEMMAFNTNDFGDQIILIKRD